MKNEENILESLKNQANPFDIPEKYFDDLEARVQYKISEQSKNISVFQKAKPYLMLAAGFALIFTIWKTITFAYLDNNISQNIENEQVKNTIDIENYELESITENEIIDIISQEEMEETEINEEVLPEIADKEAIIDYLLEENISELDIIEY